MTDQPIPSPLETVPGSPPEPPADVPGPRQALPLRFTGTGGEYFRIWIVNLLLTIATLGIYSAWAKVRRTRWFWSNTLLAGTAFQYHARPLAILRGRIVVAVLLVAYSLLGQLSVAAGLAALSLLGLAFPWFFQKAMRFKLTNTSWRGIRFGFVGTLSDAYATLLPAVVLWVGSTAVAPKSDPQGKSGVVPFLVVAGPFGLLLPFFHARVKRFQHGATTFGRLRFQFDRAVGAYYQLYLKAGALSASLGCFVGIVMMLVAAAALDMKPPDPARGPAVWMFVPFVIVLMVLP
jgi:uncharacterized membrane protein YjgN (DUF898 family)